jgi:hypothetical protein
MAKFQRPTLSLEDRLAQIARTAKSKAAELPPGNQRDVLLRKIKAAEEANSMNAFLRPQRQAN